MNNVNIKTWDRNNLTFVNSNKHHKIYIYKVCKIESLNLFHMFYSFCF